MNTAKLGLAFVPLMAALALAPQAAAQAPQQPGTPVTLRGTIDSYADDVLAITTRDGEKISLSLPDDVRISYNTQKTMADLDEGVQLGVTTVEGPDGRPHALEVHVMDQTPGVHREWDLAPDSTMTNGTVTSAADEGGNRVITVHFETAEATGDWEVVVTPDTPVVHLVGEGDHSLLVPGAYVFVSARKLDDGSYIARSVQAEKDGVKPAL